MPIELRPDFEAILRRPPQQAPQTREAMAQENQRLRTALAKAEQWGGGLEAINTGAQAQLTLQNIAYAGAVKQLNAKEKKPDRKKGAARVAAQNRVWTKASVRDELRGIEAERSRLKLAKEMAMEARQSLTQLRKARAAWRKQHAVVYKAQRKADLSEWRIEVEKHKALKVAGKGRAPPKPACRPKADVPAEFLSPKQDDSELDDEESVGDGEDEAGGSDEEE